MKKNNPPQPANKSSNTVQMKGDPADCPRLVAQLAVTPSLQAAATIKRWSNAVGELDITALIEELRQQATTTSGGDLTRQEAMLSIQAHTLDTIFNELARRAAANIGEYIGAAETYMRLALKAQGQCRTTIETLAEIKNPKPVAFVRQANIAHGPQQINNGPQAAAPDASHARETENQPTKLLEQTNGERLDFGAKGAAVGADTPLETMAAVNGTKIGGG
jgi:hypothetical protein